MKAENKSWKDIALEVGASKKDVQNRYKELMKNDGEKKEKEKSGWDTDGGGSGWATVVDGDDAGANANMPDFGALFDDVDESKDEWVREKKDDEKSGGWDTNANANEGSGWNTNGNSGSGWDTSKSGNSGNGSGDGGKKQKGGKNKNNKQQNNGGGNNTNGGNSWESNGGGSKNNQNQNQGSGFGTPFKDASTPESAPESPHQGKLKPDGVWTQDDCEALEWLMTRYKEDKWHHMQSGFFNWTKRMVTAELIEQKFRDDGAI
jgi:hypothetical protein